MSYLYHQVVHVYIVYNTVHNFIIMLHPELIYNIIIIFKTFTILLLGCIMISRTTCAHSCHVPVFPIIIYIANDYIQYRVVKVIGVDHDLS